MTDSIHLDLIHKQVSNFKIKRNRIKRVYFEIYSKLIEWHFDINNLIDKGLSININDIQK